MDQDLMRQVRERLASVIKNGCSCCGGKSFNVLDDFIHLGVSPRLSNFNSAVAHRLPAVAILCETCGTLRLTALAVLGFDLGKLQKDELTEVPKQIETSAGPAGTIKTEGPQGAE